MPHETSQRKRIRVGVFTDVTAAENAVRGLMDAGFPAKQLSVLCSDVAIKYHFRSLIHEEPAGTYTPAAALAGSTIGALLGGGAVIVTAAATGGIGLFAAGGIAAWGGGVLGGLVGAMLTRGVENEAADFYDQALRAGSILVLAEAAPDRLDLLPQAETILARAGAKPLPLAES